MKKLTTLLFAVALLVGFSSVSMAQSTNNATINATATVVGAMAVGNESNDLVFNNVLVDSWKTVNAFTNGGIATGGTVTGVTGGEERGFFSIEIVEGTDVDYSLAVPSTLGGPDTATLPIEFNTLNLPVGNSGHLNGFLTATNPADTADLSGAVHTGGGGSAFTHASASPITLGGIAMPEGGKVYLVLGGTVKAAANQATGEYTGDITLTATVSD